MVLSIRQARSPRAVPLRRRAARIDGPGGSETGNGFRMAIRIHTDRADNERRAPAVGPTESPAASVHACFCSPSPCQRSAPTDLAGFAETIQSAYTIRG